MAHRVPTRLTSAEGRRFAFTVGGAFALLGAVAWWRVHPVGAGTFVALAALLGAAGLFVPARLGPVQRAWMGFAERLSKVTTPVFMGIVFFGVITPVAFMLRVSGKRPLRQRAGEATLWHERSAAAGSSDMTRQF